MASLYSQAQEHYQSQQLGKQLEVEWFNRNINQSNQNASRNTYTEMTELAKLGSPFAQKLVEKSMAEADYQAKLSELMNPTGLSIAKSIEDGSRTEQQLAEGASLFYNSLPHLSIDQAEKLDYAKSLRSRQIAAKNFTSQTMQGLAPFVQNSIKTSNLVLRTEDGRIIDLSKGIHNTDDYNLVSQFFTQEYLKATGVLDLGKDFLMQEKTSDNITKTLKTLNANFTKELNQKNSLQRENEIRSELAADFKSEEPITKERWQYHMNRIGTLLNDKGNTLSPTEIHDWIFNYGKELAETSIKDSNLFLAKLRSGKFYGANGKESSFSTTRLDNLEVQIADNLKTNADREEDKRLTSYYDFKQRYNKGEFETKQDFYKAAGLAGLTLKQAGQIVTSSDDALKGDPEDEKDWLNSATSLTQADVDGVSSANKDLAQRKFEEVNAVRQLYKTNTPLNSEFENINKSIDMVSNFGKRLGLTDEYAYEQQEVASLAKAEIIRQYKLFLPGQNGNHLAALREAKEAVLGNRSSTWGLIGNPENIDDIREGFFWQLHLSNQDSTHRGITKSGRILFNKSAKDLDASKNDFGLSDVKEDLNLQFIVNSMTQRDRTAIKNYASNKSGSERTGLFNSLYNTYKSNFSKWSLERPMQPKDFARFLSYALGTPVPQSQQSKDLNKNLDKLTKTPGSERIIRSYKNTQACRTAGVVAQFFDECNQILSGTIPSQQPENLTFGGGS